MLSRLLNETYTFHGSPQFNQFIGESLGLLVEEIQKILESSLDAVVLGGSYGRGEGGILLNPSGEERPYNDLDLFLFKKKAFFQKTQFTRKAQKAMVALSHTYQKKLGIHIDFSRPLSRDEMTKWPHWLMWADLLEGHKILWGSQEMFSLHSPAWKGKPLPFVEATRLLLNRGAGLLEAMRILYHWQLPPDSDFVRRNYYKCALALGDALLIIHQSYNSSYRKRLQFFLDIHQKDSELANFGLISLYEKALQFKFSPNQHDIPSKKEIEELSLSWREVFLYVEKKRFQKNWSSLEEYHSWKGLRQPLQNSYPRRIWNTFQNLRHCQISWRHPREKLYRILPKLFLQSKTEKKWDQSSKQFLAVWKHFNC